MVYFLMVSIILCFLGLLFLNIYFRAKVMKAYRRLAKSGTHIKAAHIFDRDQLEKEVLVHHPKYRQDILIFVDNIKYSMRIASLLIVLITLFGGVLMFTR